MRALFIKHDHVSPTGPVGEAFVDLGFDVDEFIVVPESHFHDPNIEVKFPNLASYDAIIPMGSPWGAWDESRIGAWLNEEIALLSRAHDNGQPIFGICFGGQVMARALGGSVAPSPQAEIGWYPVMTNDAQLIEEGPWFQFHFDRWTLPPLAFEIAHTPSASQAFSLNRTLAVQFHPEVVVESLQRWIDEGGAAFVEQDGQSVGVLIELTRSLENSSRLRARRLVHSFVNNFIKRLGAS